MSLGRLAPSLPEALETASGRIELAPPRILADLPRLDRWLADPPDPRLSLIGRREMRSMNSWLHNLPSMLKGKPRCTLQIAPSDAEQRGLRTGDRARLASRVGALEVPVEVSPAMAPGVVSLPHGWGHDLPGVELSLARTRPGVNANVVVDDREGDLPSGTSVLNGVPVEVSRA